MNKKTTKTASTKSRVTLKTSATARATAAGGTKSGSSRPKRAKPDGDEAKASSKRTATKAPRVGGRSSSKGGSKVSAKTGGGAKTKTSTPKVKKAAKAAAAEPVETARDKERRALALAGAELAIECALDKKAVGPVLIDVSSQASYTDYIGIVSGRSDRQVEAIADHVSTVMKSKGWTLVGREGTSNGRWTLLDFGDLILHIFYHPVRDVYDIEGLWVGAPRVPLKNVPPEALNFQPDALYAAT